MICTHDLPTDARQFGRWIEYEGTLCLPYKHVAYQIPICELGRRQWFWIKQMFGKTWVTAQDISDLIEAIETVNGENSE